jgi:GNAT superfamily N-acetyltransferase
MLNTTGIRNQVEWLQAFPLAWNEKITGLLGNMLVKVQNASGKDTGIIEEHTRVNFKFNQGKFNLLKQNLKPCSCPVVRTNAELFGKMKGSVVPQYFWNNVGDFLQKGIGFSLVIGDEPVSTAYSAYIFNNKLELGIETSPDYRGKGFAQHACVALIEYCLQNNYEPIWSCRLENTGSYNLAKKLGFEPTVTLPYYRLP